MGTGVSGGLTVQGSGGLSDPVVISSDPDVSHSGNILDMVLSTLDPSEIPSNPIDAVASWDGLIFGDSSNLLVVAESFTISSTNLLSTIFARTYKIRSAQLDSYSYTRQLLCTDLVH